MSRPGQPSGLQRTASSSRILRTVAEAQLLAPALNEILGNRRVVEDPRDAEIRQLRAENAVLVASFTELRELAGKRGEGPFPRQEFSRMARLIGLSNNAMNSFADRLALGKPVFAVSASPVAEQGLPTIPVEAPVSPVEEEPNPPSSAGIEPKRRARSRRPKKRDEGSSSAAPAVEDEVTPPQEEEREPAMVYNPPSVVQSVRPYTAGATLPPLERPTLPTAWSCDSSRIGVTPEPEVLS